MVAHRVPTRFSEAEYLALEATSEVKHEFIDGEIVAMAGAEPAHNLLVTAIAFELQRALGRGKCRVFSSDRRAPLPEDGRHFLAPPRPRRGR